MAEKKMKERLVGVLLGIIILHLLWWLISLALNMPSLPSPVVVYQNLPNLFKDQLGWHILVSLRRIFIGLAVALILGGGLGILMGRSKKANQILDPIIYLTYPIPKLALLPMIMLLFGLGETSKIILVILILFPQIVLSVRDAILEIPEHLYDVYEGLQITPWKKFTMITFPASLSAMLSTSRISLGTAISVLFFAENYGTKFGMGHLIMDYWLRMDYPAMYGAILVLSTIGFILFLLIDLIAYRFLKWK
ncbi:ABC transporter permease [Vagococcus coleopterorum]|uniref:ABC transporter permease n=1 Tax=Vagococcus coleopterorum TaxID=2714946 RepID=A0A6G8AL78_9ENTE|nr:ABC transporter permease [Vagococcus coleopterorum]QIL45683.1 ABC transporter permease [Vagococcus coleopterorum]